MVKYKSKYSCESAIYFNQGSEIIKENCNFAYCFNNTNIKAAVLDGGNEIILANWPKHIECNTNNNIPVKIPSFPYTLLNKSVLCNCEIEAENQFFRIISSILRFKIRINNVFYSEFSFYQ